MKYAVYVEGKAEMLFVADVLQKYSGYIPEKVGFRCITLNNDTFSYVNYPIQGDESSAHFYQIVNVNNDNLVVSKLRNDIPRLVEQGFEVILGLRDVYGDLYKSLVKDQVVDRGVIAQMHAAQSSQITSDMAVTRLHFTIMEYEAWMLALIENFVVSRGFSIETIEKQLNIDLHSDIEATVFHPTKLVQKIYGLLDESYHKHESDQMSFLSTLQREDYEALRHSCRSASFGKFLDSLLDNVERELP